MGGAANSMMIDSAAPHLLVTDTDEQRAQGIALSLIGAGYRVSIATDSLEGLIAAEEARPALVLLSWTMPFIGGAIFVQVLLNELSPPPIVIAIVESEADALRASRAGVAACLSTASTAAEALRLVQTFLPGRSAGAKQVQERRGGSAQC